ncbi:hypothetical protein V6N12_009305 [Hibiscus sabdariffa]|uniref:Uncharacterized protein n=1 Tax=Hibiscus sabdariffa TaxID=183260 RepID=A0ABR2ADA0_9ROSI
MGATSLLSGCSAMKGWVGGYLVVKGWSKGCVHKGGDGSATWSLPPWQFPPKMLPPLVSSIQRCLVAKFPPKGGRSWC